jgi:hypothetical protein
MSSLRDIKAKAEYLRQELDSIEAFGGTEEEQARIQQVRELLDNLEKQILKADDNVKKHYEMADNAMRKNLNALPARERPANMQEAAERYETWLQTMSLQALAESVQNPDIVPGDMVKHVGPTVSEQYRTIFEFYQSKEIHALQERAIRAQTTASWAMFAVTLVIAIATVVQVVVAVTR